MATAIIESFIGISGLTLTLDLYPFGSDIAAITDLSLTEATNRLGLYIATTTAGLSGMHNAFIKNSSINFAIGDVYMTDDTSVHRIVDQAVSLIVQDASGTIPQQIVIKKNTEFLNFPVFMNVVKQPSNGKIGINWASGQALVSLDGEAFQNLSNLPTEVSDGLYKIDLTAEDTDANAVTLLFKVSGCDNKILSILTQQ